MPFPPPRPPHRARLAHRRPGYTLVEILTTTAIMCLIVALVMTILTQIVTAWTSSSDNLLLGEQARKIFDLMSQDLQTAIFRTDGNQWLSLTTEVPQDSPSPQASMSRLNFYTTSPLRQSKDTGQAGSKGNPIYGDICAVEYRVVYADPFANTASTAKTFSLHRVVVDPASTFLGINGRALMGIGFGAANNNETYLWQAFDDIVDRTTGKVTNTLQSSQNKTLNIDVEGAHTTQSTLQDNVAQFDVFLYYYGYSPNNAGRAPSTQVYPMTTPVASAKYYYGGGPKAGNGAPARTAGYFDTLIDTNNPPVFQGFAYADITLTILTDDGVTALQSFGGALPEGTKWTQFLQQYGKTYTQRVRFYNKPR